jgi:3-phenylpropionate/trans-cinnamate dioxygenase ferredoxin subunit
VSDWEEVAKIGEIESGTCKTVEVDGTQVALFNLDGEFYAIEDICPHDGSEISCGIILGEEIMCSRHGARFCIKTGKVTAPPAYDDIDKFPVRIENNAIQVRDERWD